MKKEKIVKDMWGNYGRIFADYMYINLEMKIF